ncbi:MAG: hypothetical protein LN575_03000 [Rickettsia endosymbiont of Gnoriste bilineata]|nr:hypothetical protein [Rickettsia endosymbiont of Gnoriste bilineata]
MLNKTEQSEAISLKLIEPEANPQSSSLLDMVAKVISSIPKGLVLGLMASEALKSVGAFPTEYNPNHQSAEPIESSDVVHHRSARAAGHDETSILSSHTLPNQHCVGTVAKYFRLEGEGYTQLYIRCWAVPCDPPLNSTAYNSVYIAEKKSSIHEDIPTIWTSKRHEHPDNQSEIIRYTFNKTEPLTRSPAVTCNEPAYPLVEAGDRLLAEEDLPGALKEYQAALEKRGDYSLALNGKAKVLAELAKITTTEAVTIAKNTTQAESSTPTTPQDRTTPSAEEQGWLWNKVGAPIVETAAGVFTIAAIAYVLHKLKQCYNKTKEVLDIELADCNEPSLLKLVDQFIPSNDNGDAKVIQDLSVSLT